ncbi:MAG TPA: pyridoxamine 5'-phosphate oxidase family protein [Acidimicrobiales bacterium]|nr:pyridoxamine 5'-phosphate oxidase family protein [Acidimicrobiales bacterium]
MGRLYDAVDGRLADFIRKQPVFFVATAPLSGDGHVNCSPKGGEGSLAVLDGRRVAYLDRTGSGAETIAHLRENGRIVIMFCSFEGPPRIVRLHGRGRVVCVGDDGFEEASRPFPPALGARAVITVDIDRISDSCGYGVPLMDFRAHRGAMDDWADKKGPDGLVEYRGEKNAASIDGLPALA